MKLLFGTFISCLSYNLALAQSCGTCTNESPEPITPVPAPWILQATVYAFPIVPVGPLPSKAYCPLEKHSTATQGSFIGLAGAILIVRYSDTPVGPYDEFVIIPGYFEYDRLYPDGSIQTRTNIRGSRFYVSQKYTNWNGRVNWNIPKHLARFDWTNDASGSTTVNIYPFDTTGDDPDDLECCPSVLPFFQMTFQPTTPTSLPIPIDTDVFQYLGISPMLGQPPLPAGNGTYNELPGTTEWAETALGTQSNMSTPGIFDLDQGLGDQVSDTGFNAVGDEFYPNFWPGLPRFNAGIRMEQSIVSFPVPETWI